MNRCIMLPLLLLGLCLAQTRAVTASAQENPPDIPAVQTIDADLKVSEDILVKEGEKLVVAPGVTLTFAASAGIICRGVVEAVGTAEKPITFTALDDKTGWANVSLLGKGLFAHKGKVEQAGGKEDTSSCDDKDSAEKDTVLEALRKAGVLDLPEKLK